MAGRSNGRSGAGYIAITGMCVGLFSLATSLIVAGYTWASVVGSIDKNRTEIERNFKEDLLARSENAKIEGEKHKELLAHISRIDTTIGGMAKLGTEVEVIKVQLVNMNETMRDIRRALERFTGAGPTGSIKPTPHNHRHHAN